MHEGQCHETEQGHLAPRDHFMYLNTTNFAIIIIEYERSLVNTRDQYASGQESQLIKVHRL